MHVTVPTGGCVDENDSPRILLEDEGMMQVEVPGTEAARLSGLNELERKRAEEKQREMVERCLREEERRSACGVPARVNRLPLPNRLTASQPKLATVHIKPSWEIGQVVNDFPYADELTKLERPQSAAATRLQNAKGRQQQQQQQERPYLTSSRPHQRRRPRTAGGKPFKKRDVRSPTMFDVSLQTVDDTVPIILQHFDIGLSDAPQQQDHGKHDSRQEERAKKVFYVETATPDQDNFFRPTTPFTEPSLPRCPIVDDQLRLLMTRSREKSVKPLLRKHTLEWKKPKACFFQSSSSSSQSFTKRKQQDDEEQVGATGQGSRATFGRDSKEGGEKKRNVQPQRGKSLPRLNISIHKTTPQAKQVNRKSATFPKSRKAGGAVTKQARPRLTNELSELLMLRRLNLSS